MRLLTNCLALLTWARVPKPGVLLMGVAVLSTVAEALPYSPALQNKYDIKSAVSRATTISALEETFLQAPAEESTRENVENWITLGLFLFIIACSLIFEMAFDSTEEFLTYRGVTSLLKMLRGAYKELTILGFISLTSFATVRLGQMQRLNDTYLGVSKTEAAALREATEAGETLSPPTHLTEVFEEIHVLIFIIMFLFILAAAVFTLVGYRLLRKYEYFDAKTETDLRNDVTMLQTSADVSEQHVNESLIYWGLRQRFIYPSIPLVPRPRERETGYPQFSFSDYISYCFGETLTGMVELPPSILIISFFIVLLLRPALDLSGREIIVFMILMAFALLGMTALAMMYTRYINEKLQPHSAKLREFFGEKRASSDQMRQAIAAPIDDRPFAVVRSTLPWRRVSNRAATLFPFGKPLYFRRLTQLLLFSHAVYTAVLLTLVTTVSQGSAFVWLAHGWWSYPLTFIPLLVSLFIWGKFLPTYSITYSVDMLASYDVIRSVEARQDAAVLEKDHRYLVFMMHEAEKLEQGKKVQIQRILSQYDQLPKEAKRSIESTFRALASSPEKFPTATVPGVVTKKDVKEVLRCLNIQTGTKDDATLFLNEWFDAVDDTGSGYVNFDKFKALIMLLGNFGVKPDMYQRFQEERLQKLFRSLDADQDNRISEEELRQALHGITPPVSKRDVDLLFKRMSKTGTDIAFEDLRNWAQKTQTRVTGPVPVYR
uniref:EF hand domain-containing protein n=1 Tax=Toxoplasma gondii COUG TaxID=1074873 RepID=A0A2G8Y9U2_TOXGO|nr:EF hand domain-containing protein [Toxoplasma gondii COUG]